MVAASDAWQKGAQQLTDDRREAFYNDLLNLQTTIGAVNASKGDGDAATWLPPNARYRMEQGFTFELNLSGVADEHRDAFAGTKKVK